MKDEMKEAQPADHEATAKKLAKRAKELLRQRSFDEPDYFGDPAKAMEDQAEDSESEDSSNQQPCHNLSTHRPD